MAAFAVGAELPPVNVGVAICAVSAYVFEYQTGVTAGAGYFLMHATQGITSLVVIEFRIRPDRFPAGIGMAVLAWCGDRPVGISHLCLGAAHLRIRIAHRLL